MASLTRPTGVSLAIETSTPHARMPIDPVSQLEATLERRTLEVAVLEYFWSR
ncbi:MAG: hypothetical protein K0U78_04800 [Actinomycetia bacterium]|nr:hypothetical protein [Actinomycetes bacterium]